MTPSHTTSALSATSTTWLTTNVFYLAPKAVAVPETPYPPVLIIDSVRRRPPPTPSVDAFLQKLPPGIICRRHLSSLHLVKQLARRAIAALLPLTTVSRSLFATFSASRKAVDIRGDIKVRRHIKQTRPWPLLDHHPDFRATQ